MIRSVVIGVTAMIAAIAVVIPAMAADGDWRAIKPEDTLVIDTTKGRIIVEMRPELAPKAVARVKLLARERVYDGLQFHRVISGFVAQTGNPNNKDGGASRHPNLEPEFTRKGEMVFVPPVVEGPAPAAPSRRSERAILAQRSDLTEWLHGSLPIITESDLTRRSFREWGAYCTGVAGMGRQADPGSANSEIFFMLAPERRLDHDYTVWGRIVVGQDVLRSLAVGEPPANPDRMTRVRVASELPERDRPRVELEDGEALRRRIDAARAAKGADFSICDVTPAARVLP